MLPSLPGSEGEEPEKDITALEGFTRGNEERREPRIALAAHEVVAKDEFGEGSIPGPCFAFQDDVAVVYLQEPGAEVVLALGEEYDAAAGLTDGIDGFLYSCGLIVARIGYGPEIADVETLESFAKAGVHACVRKVGEGRRACDAEPFAARAGRERSLDATVVHVACDKEIFPVDNAELAVAHVEPGHHERQDVDGLTAPVLHHAQERDLGEAYRSRENAVLPVDFRERPFERETAEVGDDAEYAEVYPRGIRGCPGKRPGDRLVRQYVKTDNKEQRYGRRHVRDALRQTDAVMVCSGQEQEVLAVNLGAQPIEQGGECENRGQ